MSDETEELESPVELRRADTIRVTVGPQRNTGELCDQGLARPLALSFIDGKQVSEVAKEVVFEDEADLADMRRSFIPPIDSISDEEAKKRTWPPKYYMHDLVFSMLAVCVYVFDIGTDVSLIIQYIIKRKITEMCWSIGFIVVPSVVSGIVSLSWAYIDHTHRSALPADDSHRRRGVPSRRWRILATFFQCGRIYRYIWYININYDCLFDARLNNTLSVNNRD